MTAIVLFLCSGIIVEPISVFPKETTQVDTRDFKTLLIDTAGSFLTYFKSVNLFSDILQIDLQLLSLSLSQPPPHWAAKEEESVTVLQLLIPSISESDCFRYQLLMALMYI